ncbi:hypothetical protein NQ318_014924 [Aromia moschata]|uniref:Peptidoglycan-recognition protein n=1 Tax=Aromia moschata TaxID=1265417 RepID=A0AAV8XL83_9CUCU|nr:hypothetical protein NQ318_014924 [Aromia moschata]
MIHIFYRIQLEFMRDTEEDFKHVVSYFTSSCPEIITREEWNASDPVSSKALKENPPPYVVVHHSATALCNTTEKCKRVVKGFQDYHINDQGWEDIGYNFLIGGDGKIYEGRSWGIHGAHVPKYNARSIGICLIGNFQIDEPLNIQLEALKEFISCGVEEGKILSDYHLIGHRQGGATLCPGDKLFEEIKEWAHFDTDPN